MKTKQNNMTDCTSAVNTESETELLYSIKLGVVYDEKQKEQWHNWSIGVVYVENEIELSWPIGPSVVYDKNQTRQQCDW